MTSNDQATLYTLGDRGHTLRWVNDVRGRRVTDKNGDGIGRVADLLVDEREDKIRFLLVEHGGFLGFGATKTLIPVEAITTVTLDAVSVNQSRERVAATPGYDPDLIDQRPYQATNYLHYGYIPYWSQGYTYPSGLANLAERSSLASLGDGTGSSHHRLWPS
jgi:sporulation protein YlmC with PRC-barrel domain